MFELGAKIRSIDGKSQRMKISCYYPFNFYTNPSPVQPPAFTVARCEDKIEQLLSRRDAAARWGDEL
jgi:hypothetical protein